MATVVALIVVVGLEDASLLTNHMVRVGAQREANASGARNAQRAPAAIQSAAKVIELPGSRGQTAVSILAAYEPTSGSFWWQPVTDPSALQAFDDDRCTFRMDGHRIVSVCAFGKQTITTTSEEHAASLAQGLAKAEAALRRTPGLATKYGGLRSQSR